MEKGKKIGSVRGTLGPCFIKTRFSVLSKFILLVFFFFCRLVIGGLDGTVSFFVVAHNVTPEERDISRQALKKLPSRKWQKRHLPTEDAEEKVLCHSIFPQTVDSKFMIKMAY